MKNNNFFPYLKSLAELLKKPLYIVGGAVRNHLLGYGIDDIDLAGALSPQEVIESLENSPFKVSLTSPKMFTLKIEGGGFVFEFTSFRKDTYTKGKHRPDISDLTTDRVKDAKRRDFTINAIYYDILKNEFIDPLGGKEDLKKGVIKTVDHPQRVFSQDGLRLMRLARLAAQTGMEISSQAMDAAKGNCNLIKDIAAERIRDEFDKIIVADRKYNIKNAHVRGLLLLEKIGVLGHIMPELLKGKNIEQRKDFHKYDVYNHILKSFEYARHDIRLAALFHDIAKPFCIHEDGSMKGHDKKGAEMAQEILNRLKYPKNTIHKVKRLINYHMYDLSNKAKDSTIRKFIQDNFDILDELVALKKADHKAGGVVGGDSPSALRLQKVYEQMKKENIPFSISDLKVGGRDLIELGIPDYKRGKALKTLLKATIYGKETLSRDFQIKFLKNNKF